MVVGSLMVPMVSQIIGPDKGASDGLPLVKQELNPTRM